METSRGISSVGSEDGEARKANFYARESGIMSRYTYMYLYLKDYNHAPSKTLPWHYKVFIQELAAKMFSVTSRGMQRSYST